MARISDEKRNEAARLLAEGRGAEWVASRLGITPGTVRRWRRVEPEFQALEKQYLDSLHGRGLLAVAERSTTPPAHLKAKPGVSAREALHAAILEVGRKAARRDR